MPEEYIKEHHESELRNDTISKMLYLCKRIEQFGSGFKRIDSLCKDAKVKYKYRTVPVMDWHDKDTLREWRKTWADLVNTKLAEKGWIREWIIGRSLIRGLV